MAFDISVWPCDFSMVCQSGMEIFSLETMKGQRCGLDTNFLFRTSCLVLSLKHSFQSVIIRS